MTRRARARCCRRCARTIRDRTRVATCVGFGPRFLHSTGQAYKGGPNSGVFLQITCDDPARLAGARPEVHFGVVKAAQARGDFEVLAERGRRALRVHIGADVERGPRRNSHDAVEQALIRSEGNGQSMQLGMVGLGRMGANIVRRLMRDGHECVVYDVQPESGAGARAEGANGAGVARGARRKLSKPRAVWVMVPAGDHRGDGRASLASLMEQGDIVIDGGNSFYNDDIRRAKALEAKGIHYVDVGTAAASGASSAATA